jgi:hypothetical protein
MTTTKKQKLSSTIYMLEDPTAPDPFTLWDKNYNFQSINFPFYLVNMVYPFMKKSSLTEIQFGSRVHIFPLPNVHILECQNILIENSTCTSSQYMCISQILWETDIFYGLCKKEKNYPVKSLIFSTEFFPFYTRQMTNRFFMKWLCGRVECEDVHADFLFQIFNISKCVYDVLKNKGNIYSHELKHHSFWQVWSF